MHPIAQVNINMAVTIMLKSVGMAKLANPKLAFAKDAPFFKVVTHVRKILEAQHKKTNPDTELGYIVCFCDCNATHRRTSL